MLDFGLITGFREFSGKATLCQEFVFKEAEFGEEGCVGKGKLLGALQ